MNMPQTATPSLASQLKLDAHWMPFSANRNFQRDPRLIVAAEGSWLIDTEGKRYLDGISSWWTNLFGHCNPRINAALIDQLGRLEHVMLAGFTHQPVVELSERLAALSGLGHAFYGSDGASATEIALKMSFQYWQQSGAPQKSRFIHLEHSYHGETLGALAVTDVPLFRQTYAPLLNAALTAPSPDARLAGPGETAETVARRVSNTAARYLASRAAVGPYLADQLLLPLALAGGSFTTVEPSAHTRSNLDVIRRFLPDLRIGFDELGPDLWRIRAGGQEG